MLGVAELNLACSKHNADPPSLLNDAASEVTTVVYYWYFAAYLNTGRVEPEVGEYLEPQSKLNTEECLGESTRCITGRS